jgi:hypothetical protein
MVRKEDVYRAYIATCQAEGWPTRYTRQTLGKAVKRVFPLVSTRRLSSRLCVKQYYVGLCPQLQQQLQLHCWSTANANNNNNNHCGDCWVDGLQCYPSSLLLQRWYARLQAAPAAERVPHKPVPGLLQRRGRLRQRSSHSRPLHPAG